MRYLRYFALLAVLAIPATYSQAQVAVGIGVAPGWGYNGGPPRCAYGYYDYYPYACAPYGFYGPNWFASGVFIGAGPWYRGYWGRSYYGRGWYGRGWEGREWGDRDFRGRGYGYGRGYSYGRGVGRGWAGGGYRGGNGFHGGGGGFHGGGGHGGGHR